MSTFRASASAVNEGITPTKIRSFSVEVATRAVTSGSQNWRVRWPLTALRVAIALQVQHIFTIAKKKNPIGGKARTRFRRRARATNVLFMSDDPATPTSPKLQVQIDEDVAQGVYSNLVLLNHTENEFVLDFAFIQPSNGRAKVRARVVSSPRHTKRLLNALQKNLERYEERFGRIELGPDEEPMLH